MKKYVGVFLIAVLGAVAGGAIVTVFMKPADVYVTNPSNYNVLRTTSTGATVVETPDFISASASATPAVVHVKSYYSTSSSESDRYVNPFEYFDNGGRSRSSGSGVIISGDGYIATNNHVVERASKVEVVLEDKRSFVAKVIGTDPTTDLALLKIESQGLPFLQFANSDQVQVGEWALAVGNPFNLTSTVTAGIVSAKGRSLNLLNEEFKIESFIQTDAAVNPGNSGGALINTHGKLIGINTAIASRTGSYAGYSFAVPGNLVKKVTDDLREYGEVQRGIIGVRIKDINADFAKQNDLTVLTGAYVTSVMPGGAAADAGIKSGDVIMSVDGQAVAGSSELQEIVGRHRPGENVKVSLMRAGANKEFNVKLKSIDGTTGIVAADPNPVIPGTTSKKLGAEFEAIDASDKTRLGIKSGVKVKKVSGGMFGFLGIDPGFIITKINKESVSSPSEAQKKIEEADGRVQVEGLNSTGAREYYSFNF